MSSRSTKKGRKEEEVTEKKGKEEEEVKGRGKGRKVKKN